LRLTPINIIALILLIKAFNRSAENNHSIEKSIKCFENYLDLASLTYFGQQKNVTQNPGVA